jgi:hypothetical protein
LTSFIFLFWWIFHFNTCFFCQFLFGSLIFIFWWFFFVIHLVWSGFLSFVFYVLIYFLILMLVSFVNRFLVNSDFFFWYIFSFWGLLLFVTVAWFPSCSSFCMYFLLLCFLILSIVFHLVHFPLFLIYFYFWFLLLL